MITVEDVLEIHTAVISKFGGADGVRDLNALESALARPFQTFNGQELNNSIFEKAAALLQSILINHPFIDGNKRTAYVLARLFLQHYKTDITATENEKYNFIIDIASGKTDFENIVKWLARHTNSL